MSGTRDTELVFATVGYTRAWRAKPGPRHASPSQLPPDLLAQLTDDDGPDRVVPLALSEARVGELLRHVKGGGA